jgi:hypothetical protein
MNLEKNKERIGRALNEWELSTDILAKAFVQKYFGEDATEEWWVSDDIGGVYVINDYFFSVHDIVDFLKYDYSTKKMFEYYDYALKLATKEETPINIKNWKKLKK